MRIGEMQTTHTKEIVEVDEKKMVKVPVTKDDSLAISFDFENKIFGINIDFNKWSLVLNDKIIFKSFEWLQKETKEKTVVFESKVEDLKKPEDQPVGSSSPSPSPTTKGGEEQQIQPPLKDQKMQRFLIIFESLYGIDGKNKVNVSALRREASKSGLFKGKEFNQYLNQALSENVIEEVEDEIGYYKMRK